MKKVCDAKDTFWIRFLFALWNITKAMLSLYEEGEKKDMQIGNFYLINLNLIFVWCTLAFSSGEYK